MNKLKIASAFMLAVTLSVGLIGCGSSSPSEPEKKRIKSLVAAQYANNDTSAIYDETYSLEKMSDGCDKVTIAFKYDINGQTHEGNYTLYYKDATAEEACTVHE